MNTKRPGLPTFLLLSALLGCHVQPAARVPGAVPPPGAGTAAPQPAVGVDLTGEWVGVLLQPEGPFQEYEFSMRLLQQGDRIEGSSLIVAKGTSLFGVLTLTGMVSGKEFIFNEIEVADQNSESMLSWCIKSGVLLYDASTDSLSGDWTAPGCAPGLINVARNSGGVIAPP